MREPIPMLLTQPVGAGLRLLLAGLLAWGLGHTSSQVVHAQGSIQPSWVDPLPLDGTPVEGVLGTPQDVDYFQIEVTELTEAVIYSRSELPRTRRLRCLTRWDSRSRRTTMATMGVTSAS